MSDLAFNIAVYLNEHDLFMDLYYYAKSVDSVSLAASAWQKAEQILVEESAANVSCSSKHFQSINHQQIATFINILRISDSEDCCSCSGSSSEIDNCSFLEIKDEQSEHQIPTPSTTVKRPVIRPPFVSVASNQNLPNICKNSLPDDHAQTSRQKVKFSDVITKITLPEVRNLFAV